MIAEQTFETYPVFGDNATKVQPDAAKYAAGFLPADVLPAEWENWAWNKNTKGITDLNRGLSSVEKELNSVLAVKSVTPAEGTNNQVIGVIQSLIADAILAAHPVGSLYWSSKSTDPAQLFGGIWTQIKDKFVWAKGDSDTVNAMGGAKTVTLTIENLPSHTHTGPSHTHGMAHKHNYTPSGTIASHTHSFTPSGSVSSHSHTLNNGNTSSAGTTTTAGFRSIEHGHDVGVRISNVGVQNDCISLNDSQACGIGAPYTGNWNSSQLGYRTTFKGGGGELEIVKSVSVTGYLYGKTDNTTPTFTGTAGTTGGTAPAFTGTKNSTSGSITTGSTTSSETARNTTEAAGTGNTGATGSGTAVDKMPPYIVKYCWERTA